MPLQHIVNRKKLHHRNISCEGFIREDGLWDIEAHLLDRRTYDCSYDQSHRDGLIKAGESVHDMWVRITIDIDFVIHDAEAASDLTPFGICGRAADEMKSLIGIKIGSGWMKLVRERISLNASCTHLIDLLAPISATAYQTLHTELEKRAAKLPARQKPVILDTCLALASDGDVVKKRWPEFYRGSSTLINKEESA
jgi:hypothetical protein